MNKALLYVAALLSFGVGVLAIKEGAVPNCFMPFAVCLVALTMTTNKPGILKGVFAQTFIAAGGFFTGLMIGDAPLFVPGLKYFLFSVTIPLLIVAALDFNTYKNIPKKEIE